MTVRNGFVNVQKNSQRVAGFSYSGKLKVKKSLNKAKINSLYYPQNILEPIFDEGIPVLYGQGIDKVELPMDKASSHTSKSNTAYLAKRKNQKQE
ncbi:hypothetical protein TNCV_3659071 [Trichonephila clavipes]|nr:hypothetical protein TNCV_3659071 [Trichonephila clavipes]